MFERAHHQRIATLLAGLDAEKLERWGCYFGGGTAVTLALGEYRESVDVDFLCASTEGYRALRLAVFDGTINGISRGPLRLLRDVKADQYGVRTFVEIDGSPIRLELIREARIELSGSFDPSLGVAVLAREDLIAEKLLANVDRFADAATFNRDAIDLAMMLHAWGPAPETSWRKARSAYGDTVDRAFGLALERLRDPAHLARCLSELSIDAALAPRILEALALNTPA